MNTSHPVPGTEIEIWGTRGTLLVVEEGMGGEAVFTSRVTQGNLQVIIAKAEKAGVTVVQLSDTLIQAPASACVAKFQGNGSSSYGFVDTRKSQSLARLQKDLARRMRFSA